jgi:methylase of polypeptide subunit release factors
MATTRKLGQMLVSADRERVVQIDADKVSRGSFYTTDSAWLVGPVRDFMLSAGIDTVVDPFAGDGHLLDLVSDQLGLQVAGFDISGDKWPKNDSLIKIPLTPNARGQMPIIVTNPPYLANHSAKRKGVDSLVAKYFKNSPEHHDNLYKIALQRCLETADYLVAIIPETFLLSSFDKSRVQLVAVIESELFGDTDAPAVVACFGPKPTRARVFVNDRDLGELDAIMNLRARGGDHRQKIIFNDPAGRIGLRAVDGSDGKTPIRFMPASEFEASYPRESIKVSSRLMTYLELPNLTDAQVATAIERANQRLAEIRLKSHDLVLAPFKGNDKTGKRRRRLDYALARSILNQCTQ